LWRSISFLFGIGAITLVGAGLSVFGVLSIAGVGWLFAAAFLVLLALVVVGGYRLWSPMEHALGDLARELVSEDHGNALRALAGRLQKDLSRDPGSDGPGSWVETHTFVAHFPRIDEVTRDYRRLLQEESETLAALLAAIQDGIRANFPKDEGWAWGSIKERTETHLDSILDGEAQRIDLGAPGDLVWLSTLLKRGVPGTEVRAQRLVSEWLTEVGNSDEAKAYREARKRVAAAQVLALALLDPIINGQPILKVSACQICYPP
jgi:hypothetical protein